jgi:hypothetical protein
MTWWLWQLIFVIGVVIIHTFNRCSGLPDYGISLTFAQKWGINAGWQALISPTVMISYATAPSFFQPWFFATTVIAVAGFLVSIFFFGETITLIKIIGALLGIISAVLLII